ncbi:hypothetical protein V1523DRAFT_42148 [Lipomyces doorenjongii]
MARKPSPVQSRQKSCIACADGKRRCNRQTPQCSRCLRRGVECVYINGPSAHQMNHTPLQQIDTETLEIFDQIIYPFEPFDSSLSENADINSWLPISPSLLTPPPDASFPEIAFLDRWSINKLLQKMKYLPQMFACSRKTPFMHARLYDANLPNAIQDAFTISASYYTKTPETEDMIFRILEAKSVHLVEQNQNAQSLEEHLAAVQALMLFQIIQLFDGDIRQRSLAEQNMTTLRVWTTQLRIWIRELGPASTWQSWIFAESVRRTIIMSDVIEGLYSALKFGYCANIPTLSIHPFTSGAALWDATSSTAWLREANCASSETVLYGDFSKAWRAGQVSGKLDSFQKLLLIPCVGEKYREVLEFED